MFFLVKKDEKCEKNEICMNQIQRRSTKNSLGDMINVTKFNVPKENCTIVEIRITVKKYKKNTDIPKLNHDQFIKKVKRNFINQILCLGQKIPIQVCGYSYICKIGFKLLSQRKNNCKIKNPFFNFILKEIILRMHKFLYIVLLSS